MIRFNKLNIVIVSALLLSLFVWSQPQNSYACTPTATGNPPPTVADRVSHADLVFTGTVTDVVGQNWDQVVTITVDHYFKGGNGAPIVDVVDWGDGATCRSSVTPGQTLLFYVLQYSDGSLHADWLTAGGAIDGPDGELLAELLILTEDLEVTQPVVPQVLGGVVVGGEELHDEDSPTEEVEAVAETDVVTVDTEGASVEELIATPEATDEVVLSQSEAPAGSTSIETTEESEQGNNFRIILIVLGVLSCGLLLLLGIGAYFLLRRK